MSVLTLDRIRTTEEAFLYYTECQLATLVQMLTRKSTSAADKSRQRAIALGMLQHVADRGMAHENYGGLPRINQVLQPYPAQDVNQCLEEYIYRLLNWE